MKQDKLDEDLVEELDRQFPKGKCKERGNALVLFAKTQLKINDLRKAGKTIKVEGYSEGDRSVGISSCDFSIDTGLTKLDDNERKWIIKTIIKGVWELHDNGDLHFGFSDEEEDDWDYTRRFGYDENLMLLKEGITEGLKNED